MMILFAAVSFGQNASDKLFEKYSGQEGVTSVHITSYMFELFADLEGEDDMKEFQELAAQIDRIKILSCENSEQQPDIAKDFYADISKNIPLDSYKPLMEVREEDQEVNVLIQESNKKISEVLMLVHEVTSTVLISVTGDIDLNKLAKLSSAMNIDGFENLEDIEEYDE
jgi:hypothetical protein